MTQPTLRLGSSDRLAMERANRRWMRSEAGVVVGGMGLAQPWLF